MSLQDLQTTMRELSTNANDGKMVQQFIDQEIAVLESKQGDIISFLCRPGIRIMEPIPTKWYTTLVSGKQWTDPNNTATFLYDPVGEAYGSSTVGYKWELYKTSPSPHVASDTLTQWEIRRYNIWEYTGGTGAGVINGMRLVNPAPTTPSSTITYSDLTNDKLDEFGYDTATFNLDLIQQYVDQWNLGMEWLHACPTIYSIDGVDISSTNPYAGSLRSFGIKMQIDQHRAGRSSQDTNTAFYDSAFANYDSILP